MNQYTIRLLGPNDFDEVSNLFRIIVSSEDDKKFHPHIFSDDVAKRICSNLTMDSYFGAFSKTTIVGYGMLRGWDEGFNDPSLGIYLTREHRGTGLSRELMFYMHDYAKIRNARRVILKVYGDNCKAVSLYKSLGYNFYSENDGQLCAAFDIKPDNLEGL